MLAIVAAKLHCDCDHPSPELHQLLRLVDTLLQCSITALIIDYPLSPSCRLLVVVVIVVVVVQPQRCAALLLAMFFCVFLHPTSEFICAA